MNLGFNIAKRYFFGKKSTNAINIITAISVLGVAIGTAVLLLIASVFNGFEDLIQSLYSSFQPDISIRAAEGKVFKDKEISLSELEKLEYIDSASKTLEEIAFFEYKGGQDFGIIKGVDENWRTVSQLDSVIYEGKYQVKNGSRNMAIVGYGMRNKLGVSVSDKFSEISVFMLKNRKVGPLEKPFKKQYLYPAGTFVIQQQFDEKYIISNLEFAQKLRGYKEGEISQIEIRLKEGTHTETALQNIQKIVGNRFEVKDRYRQNEAFFKLMKVEKWLGFAITGLAMVLVAINLVGCMFMLIHEKKKDIATLKAMGADNNFIKRIFLNVGMLMCGIGMIVGIIIAICFYAAHKTFNLIPMEGFIVDAYPMSFRLFDFVVTIIFVLIFGYLFSLYPAQRAANTKSLIRND